MVWPFPGGGGGCCISPSSPSQLTKKMITPLANHIRISIDYFFHGSGFLDFFFIVYFLRREQLTQEGGKSRGSFCMIFITNTFYNFFP